MIYVKSIEALKNVHVMKLLMALNIKTPVLLEMNLRLIRSRFLSNQPVNVL